MIKETYQDGYLIATEDSPNFVPESVDSLRLLKALDEFGALDDVEAFVATKGTLDKLAWARATEVRRDNPMLNECLSGMGFTDLQVDAIFLSAYHMETT